MLWLMNELQLNTFAAGRGSDSLLKFQAGKNSRMRAFTHILVGFLVGLGIDAWLSEQSLLSQLLALLS